MHGFAQKIASALFSKKFAEFCVIGTINTFNTAWVSAVLSMIWQPNIAAAAGYLFSLSIAYCLNCRVVFECPLKKSTYLLFLLTYIPNFIIYFLITFVTINTLNLPQFWGTVLANAICGPLTFLLIKFFTFSKK